MKGIAMTENAQPKAEEAQPILSLADLADLDISEIEEVRFENLPAMVAGFEVVSAELAVVGKKEDPVARIKCKVVTVMALVDDSKSPDDLINKTHSESLFIGREKPREGIGRTRAFISDAGGNSAGVFGQVLAGFVGTQFVGRIHHRKGSDGNDYANIRFDGIPEAPESV